MQKINLFVSYFNSRDIARQKEIDYCYNTNKDSGFFDSVINFHSWPMYDDFFNETKNYSKDINVLANADIYFNETILYARDINPNESYALTRWEESEGEVIPFDQKHQYNNNAKAMHSQDVWIFNGETKGINGAFPIGVPGCDNRIAYEIGLAGYQLKNPSNVIQCIHKHKSDSRNYNRHPNYGREKVPPPYRWVKVGGGSIRPRISI